MRAGKPLGPMVTWVFDALHLMRITSFATFNKLRFGTLEGDPFSLIHVSPAAITQWVEGVCMVAGATWRRVGEVRSGDWDKNLQPFEERASWEGMFDRFVHGKQWQETRYYSVHTASIREGHVRWGCVTVDEFEARCSATDDLFKAIRAHGYRTQRELLKDRLERLTLRERRQLLDEVVVCIGRNGEFLFADGQHRLSIAKILNLSQIPVRVLSRHTEWQAFRRQLTTLAAQSDQQKLPQRAPHPDLQFIPSRHDSDRWARHIHNVIGDGPGRLLEVDAGVSGFFADFFEKNGWQCWAWEDDRSKQSLLQRMKSTTGRSYEIVDSSAAELEAENQFGVAIWFVETADLQSFQRRVIRLKRLVTKHIVLIVPDTSDGINIRNALLADRSRTRFVSVDDSVSVDGWRMIALSAMAARTSHVTCDALAEG